MGFPKGDADTYFEPIIFKSVYCCVEETLKQPMRTQEDSWALYSFNLAFIFFLKKSMVISGHWLYWLLSLLHEWEKALLNSLMSY